MKSRLPTRRRASVRSDPRGIVSISDWRRPRTRGALRLIQGATLIVLLIIGLGPILWLAKSAITPT